MDIYGSFCLLVTFQKEDQIFLTKVNTLILNHILLKQLNKKKIFFSSKININFKLHFSQTIEQKNIEVCILFYIFSFFALFLEHALKHTQP